MFIFNRKGACLFEKEWQRAYRAQSQEEEQKLMYGLVFSLKDFVKKSSPTKFEPFFHPLELLINPSFSLTLQKYI